MTIFEKVAKLDTFYAHSNWSVKCHRAPASGPAENLSKYVFQIRLNPTNIWRKMFNLL
jgi:hypothetical protein